MKAVPCEDCDRWIADNSEGVIYIDEERAGKTARLFRQLDEEAQGKPVNVAEVLVAPDSEPWHWACSRCYIDHEKRTYYRLNGDQIETLAQALDSTLHLQEKAWYYGTDRGQFIRSRFPSMDG